MSWNDFYARRDIMRDAVHRAAKDSGRLPFAELDRAEELFGTERQLLLALYYRWTMLLGGKLRAMAAAPEDGHAPELDTDLADRVSAAWRETAAEHATLRAVLDAAIETDTEALRHMLASEQRMLAFAAGLADPGEPIADATQVGGSFLALIRHAGAVPERGQRARSARRRRLSIAS
ncbi:MAG: hypothetical protein GEV04_20170 [Actinophytocola sp.]|nr:hypothetical protein [Actinophytocola sp.]